MYPLFLQILSLPPPLMATPAPIVTSCAKGHTQVYTLNSTNVSLFLHLQWIYLDSAYYSVLNGHPVPGLSSYTKCQSWVCTTDSTNSSIYPHLQWPYKRPRCHPVPNTILGYIPQLCRCLPLPPPLMTTSS